MKNLVIATLLAFAFSFTSPAQAAQYIKPTYADLLRTLIRFNAIDLSDDRVIDEYAMVMDCKNFAAYYRDDFAWQKYREALRATLKQNTDTIPDSYYYNAELQLDRYDFKANMFRLTEKSSLSNVNSFTVYESAGVECATGKAMIIPKTFRLVLDKPLSIAGIPLAEADAKTLLDRMSFNKNRDRILYVRFNMRIIDIVPFHHPKSSEKKALSPLVQDYADGGKTRMKSQLGSVDFYEDIARTKLIYSYRP